MRYRRAGVLFLGSWMLCGAAEAQFRAPQDLAPGEDFVVELGLMFWTPTPELVIGSDAFTVTGSSEIDFVQEFELGDKRFREFRATVKAGRKHKIRFSSLPVRYDETRTIQRTITFQGRTFPVQAEVDARLDWDLWRFGYEWDFVARSRGLVGLVAELKYNRVTAELTSGSLSALVDDVRAPVPTIGLIARGYPHRNFSVTGEFTGFKLTNAFVEDFEARFTDLDIYGTLSFGRSIAVQAGYRSVAADYVVESDSGDLRLKGTYFGGLIRF